MTQEFVVEKENTALVHQSPTPSDLLRIAVSQNADIDKLSKLMDLQERWEANEAKKAYNAALEAFKKNPPSIDKNKHVRFETTKGVTEYDHATLDHVCDILIPVLSSHGLTHRWKVAQDEKWITVTCVLTHSLGHAEETTLMGGPDLTGGKNAVQAISSTVTYLQRYTLLAACGLAAKDSDDDARSAAGVPKERIEELCEWMANAKDLPELKKLFEQACTEAQDAKDRTALAHFKQAKDARKAELQ